MFAVVAAAAAVACKYCWLVVVNAGMVVSCFAHLPAILGWPPHTGIKTICYIYNFKNNASEIIRIDDPNNAIQCDTEYNASARYAKGHGDVCYNYRLRYCPQRWYLPLIRVCGGARQDASFEAALPIYAGLDDMFTFTGKCLTV